LYRYCHIGAKTIPRLCSTRSGAEADVMTLKAECAHHDADFREAIATTLRAVTRLGGSVELVPMASLANDGMVIADERH
jgi:phenylacetate-CoA ligase